MRQLTATELEAARRAGIPGFEQRPPAPTRTSGMAVASLVLGILWLGWVGSLLAVIFGHAARGEIRRSGGTIGGNGMATAGTIFGWVGLVVVPIIIMGLVLAAVSSGTTA